MDNHVSAAAEVLVPWIKDESLRQVLAQTRSVTVPRPDATLAAIAAAAAGR